MPRKEGHTIDEKYTKNVDPNSIKFENKNLMIGVDFDKNGNAEGVYLESLNLQDMDFVTQKGSYVSLHYNELVRLATGGKNIKVESDNIKYNQSGTKKYPGALLIGTLHE